MKICILPKCKNIKIGPVSIENFMRMPLNDLLGDIKVATLQRRVGKTFELDEIMEAHRTMKNNQAGEEIVVLTKGKRR